MPQMMPINWMISFILFIFIFILFNILNYYIFNINKKFNKTNNIKSHKLNLTWKW
uniref:ATP synthase complex subunit 8 n=1 Tax=Tagiades trebellius martinus TaxID=3016723 RepID=A0AA96KJN1_9NEOP|nr:ATP synthase F0 subunit 8 [Tagiades trebellius martinus]